MIFIFVSVNFVLKFKCETLFFLLSLVISNWSYLIPSNEFKSREELTDILNELLPVDSLIKLNDPLLTTCRIDGQFTLRCDTPNTELMLTDRVKNCFVLAKLDDLRERGNQAYIRGNLQLAVDYYTFAIQRIVSMTQMAMSNNNECEMNLFREAFQYDVCRFHSNRAACYVREGLYGGSNLDTFVVVIGRHHNETHDELFFKCLYRLISSMIALQKCTHLLDKFFELAQNSSINNNLHGKYLQDINEVRSCLPRLKDEYQNGKYDLKQMFNNQSINQTNLFNSHLFHSNYRNNSCIKQRNESFYAKSSIPAGTLLLVENAFVFVKSDDGITDERRLLNAIEKHLIIAPTVLEFNSIRHMPHIYQWFENETDANEDDAEFVLFSNKVSFFF